MPTSFLIHLRLAGLLLAGLAACILCTYAHGQAEDKTYEQLISLADQRAIYLNSQWLALLHYRQKKPGLWISEADNPAFFLSAEGRQSPRDELLALISALIKENTYAGPSVFCSFPARTRWVIHQLELGHIAIPACPELEKWKSAFATDSISILFASAYMGNPASMFGHTFLRFAGKSDDKNQALFSMTLNYAANAQGDDGYFKYISKGLTGGFTGIVESQPLFMHLRRYVENEGRDLWEYHLGLSKKEIELITMHAWEIRENFFDYYYLDENCSYRILSILAVARPELFNQENFEFIAAPIDTIRELAKQGLIYKVVYRPSAIKQFAAHTAELSAEERDIAYKMARGLIGINDAAVRSLEPERKSAVLFLAMEYLGLIIQRSRTNSIERDKLVFELIKARANTDTKFIPHSDPVPAIDPVLGHKTRRLLFSVGTAAKENYLEAGFRPAGHDLLDPIEGQAAGAQTEFLNFNYRFLQEGGGRLEKFEIVHLSSYTPLTKFFHSRSLDFNISRDRKLLQDQSVLFSTVGGSMGYSILANERIYSALVKLDLDYNGKLSNRPVLAAGARIFTFGQFTSFSYQISYDYENYIDNDAQSRRTISMSGSVPINVNNALRLTAQKSRHGRHTMQDVNLGYYFYF